MHTLLRKKSFYLLVGLAIFFLAVVIGFYSWGIGYLVIAVNQANNGNPAGQTSPAQFNLDAAAKLDYRGTLPADAATSVTGN